MACSCRLHELTSVAFLCCKSAAMPHGAAPSDTDGGLWQVRRLGLRRETEAAVRAAELPKTPGDSSSRLSDESLEAYQLQEENYIDCNWAKLRIPYSSSYLHV